MVATKPLESEGRKKPINLNLTPEIIDWLDDEAKKLGMTSKAVAARVHLERAMRESQSEPRQEVA